MSDIAYIYVGCYLVCQKDIYCTAGIQPFYKTSTDVTPLGHHRQCRWNCDHISQQDIEWFNKTFEAFDSWQIGVSQSIEVLCVSPFTGINPYRGIGMVIEVPECQYVVTEQDVQRLINMFGYKSVEIKQGCVIEQVAQL